MSCAVLSRLSDWRMMIAVFYVSAGRLR